MKSFNKVIFLVFALTLASCGVQTAPPSDFEANGNTSTNGVQTASGSFSTVTRTVPTIGSEYYSYQGELHSSCTSETSSPICTSIAKTAQCDVGIPGCYYGASGTYTYYEQVTFVNECSLSMAEGSPQRVYSYPRPCSY